MGIFDIFGTGDQQAAAAAQTAGLNAGYNQASGSINQGIGAINSGYTAALQPFTQNYNQAQGGVTALQNVLGLNGPQGNASATQALQATPGYGFQANAGNAAINAQAAATGQNASGNQALALQKQGQGLADTTYNQYVSQLEPFLGASATAASGIGGVNTGQANALAGQYGSLANLGYQTQTGIGNANANADLAGLSASGNILGAIGGIGGALLGGPLGGALGGSLGSMFGGSFGGGTAGSAIPGSFGPTSFGGANGPTPLTGGSFLGQFSDERLKEFIEPVGELYDGTNVYRYNYIGDPTPRIGVMAQEVEKTRPDAVVEIGGWKAVDYSKATDLSAALARFSDSNVVNLDDHRAKPREGYAADLSRFLDAA
jgi:endosialidase-like protein